MCVTMVLCENLAKDIFCPHAFPLLYPLSLSFLLSQGIITNGKSDELIEVQLTVMMS